MNSNSENEDDPCSSGEDWKEAEIKRNQRRLSSRLSKKPRMSWVDEFSSESESSDDDDYDEDIDITRNGRYKKHKSKQKKPAPIVAAVSAVAPREVPAASPVEQIKPVVQMSNRADFTNGSFVILKADAQSFEPSKPAHIWRIDGKALLQKYEPFTEEGDLKYRNTSVYTGWSSLESDKYSAVKDINIVHNTNQKFILTFDWNQFKSIIIDSD